MINVNMFRQLKAPGYGEGKTVLENVNNNMKHGFHFLNI